MRVIDDSDTVELIDDSGDKLILLAGVRQKDIDACEEIERQEAFAQFEGMKALMGDTRTAAAVEEAEKLAPEERKTIADAASQAVNATPKVRRFRLGALGVRLVIDGESIGGKAILETYEKMPRDSAAWVDARIAEVWDSATPSEADTRGEDADAACSPAPVSAAPEPSEAVA